MGNDSKMATGNARNNDNREIRGCLAPSNDCVPFCVKELRVPLDAAFNPSVNCNRLSFVTRCLLSTLSEATFILVFCIMARPRQAYVMEANPTNELQLAECVVAEVGV